MGVENKTVERGHRHTEFTFDREMCWSAGLPTFEPLVIGYSLWTNEYLSKAIERHLLDKRRSNFIIWLECIHFPVASH